MQDLNTIIDLWNWYIKAIVFWEEDGKTITVVKHIEKTKWLRKWKILDINLLSQQIIDIIELFIKKLWWDFIDDVILSISHPQMEITRLVETKRIMSWTIQSSDIQHLSNIIGEIWQKDNYETIKIIPTYWLINEQKKEKDPVGLQAKKLTLVADVFKLPKTFYSSILWIFDKIWVRVSDIVPNVLATTESVLDFDQRDLWTMLIDIGTNQTSFVIFEDWYPLHFETLSIGSEDVTKDISIWMQIDIKEAEKLKIEEWTILLDNKKTNDTQLDVWFLSHIIQARYEEIFEKINNKLVKLWKDWRLAWWVFLSWWWSKMNNILSLAKKEFKIAAFDSKDTKLHLWDISKNKQFINTIWAFIRNQQYWNEWSWWFWMNFGFLSKIWKFFKDLF